MRREIRQIRDMQTQLYQYRVKRGRYLSDVPFLDLSYEERTDIVKDTRSMLFDTGLVLRLVVRKRRKVWRFVDQN